MITIVTGLPRSGTSLMMQMLQAGGLDLLTDGIRNPDEDNPKGYFELERVKSLGKDSAWLTAAQGKAVKIISLLLFELPSTHRYRILFMTRNLDEVLTSQRDMLARRGVSDPGPDDASMRRHFETHLAKIQRHLDAAVNMETLYCNYNELVADPSSAVAKIADFLGGPLDRQRMIAAVDLSLYRKRR
jgi:hypothetical protein